MSNYKQCSHGYNDPSGSCEQCRLEERIRELEKDKAELIKTCESVFTLSAMRSEPYIPRCIRQKIEGVLRQAIDNYGTGRD